VAKPGNFAILQWSQNVGWALGEKEMPVSLVVLTVPVEGATGCSLLMARKPKKERILPLGLIPGDQRLSSWVRCRETALLMDDRVG
jgi:hypothetical protein